MAQTQESYRSLEVWQVAVELVEAVYRLTAGMPGNEQFGLTSQIRRAAVSVPADIAEGYGRIGRRDYIRHLGIARGSLMELETHIVVATRMQMREREQSRAVWDLTQRVGQMLSRLIASLQTADATKQR